VEGILGLVGVVIIWILFGLVIRAVTGTIRAGTRAARGQGTFSDNFHSAVVGMGPLEAKIIDTKLSGDADSISIKEIQVKGLLPIHKRYRLAFVTSLFDKTSGEFEAIMSGVESFQEPHTLAYQHTNELGSIEPGSGLMSWARVGAIIPQIITTPYSGKRQLVAILRLIDLNEKPDITRGFHQPDSKGLLWQRSLPFEYETKEKGYLEVAEQRDKARLLCVRIAMAIAMWNGSLGDQEGEIVKSWIEKILSGRSGEHRIKLKDDFNLALRDAYLKATNNELSLTELTEGMNEIDDNTSKFETVELCFDVLSCSGIDSSDKARVIDLVARALKLDSKEIERIRDVKIVGLSTELSKQVRIEDLLGIDEQWTSDKIKKHLRSEFQKWNNRLTTLPEGEERNNAQRMLDAIAEVRRKND
jgi:hypothetical protein